MIRGRAARAAFALTLLALMSCGKPMPLPPPLVETLAVLPFDNESNDLNAPDVLQDYVYRALLASAYKPIDIRGVNEKLETAGIIDGGQLAAVDPVKLGKDLAVHALMFGNVESFGYTNLGYFTSRKVTVELKLIEVQTGQVLWEHTGTGAHRSVTLDPQEAKRKLAEGVAQQVIDKATKNVLEAEVREAVASALSTLPGYKFCGFSGVEGKPVIQIGQKSQGFKFKSK